MSELALSRSQHKEIKELAEKIIDNYSREISDMASWYNYGLTLKFQKMKHLKGVRWMIWLI